MSYLLKKVYARCLIAECYTQYACIIVDNDTFRHKYQKNDTCYGYWVYVCDILGDKYQKKAHFSQ